MPQNSTKEHPLFDLHHLEWNPCDDGFIHPDVEGVLGRFFEPQALKVDNKVLRKKEGLFGNVADFKLKTRSAGWQNIFAVRINQRDDEFVFALVLVAEQKTKRKGALGMDRGKPLSVDRIERAQDAQFALIISRRITQNCG